MELLEPIQWSELSQYTFIPIAGTVQAGFPSPAGDYMENRISLDRECIKNPSTTFFWRVKGDSMSAAFIPDGALIVVDRSLTARDNDIILAEVDGELTVKRLCSRLTQKKLLPDSLNPKHRPIEITEFMHFEVWGVVTHIVTNVKTL